MGHYAAEMRSDTKSGRELNELDLKNKEIRSYRRRLQNLIEETERTIRISYTDHRHINPVYTNLKQALMWHEDRYEIYEMTKEEKKRLKEFRDERN